VPAPVVVAHVSQGGIDTALGGNGVGARWKEFRDAGSVETGFCKANCGAESCAAGAYNESTGNVSLWERRKLGGSGKKRRSEEVRKHTHSGGQ